MSRIETAVQSMFRRDNQFQTVRACLADPTALATLDAHSNGDPRLRLEVKSEQAYFAEFASQTTDLILQ